MVIMGGGIGGCSWQMVGLYGDNGWRYWRLFMADGRFVW